MAAPVHHQHGRPPRSQLLSKATISKNAIRSGLDVKVSPYTSPCHSVSPRTPKHVSSETKICTTTATPLNPPSPRTPKRPLSASRAQSSSPFISSHMPARIRPSSASRIRPTQETRRRHHLGIHSEDESHRVNMDSNSATCRQKIVTTEEPSLSPSKLSKVMSTTISNEQQSTVGVDADATARFQIFLESWQDDNSIFRSPVLLSETIFAQARALVDDWPHPNTFLSAVAFGLLEQFGHSLDRQYPFLNDIISEIGAAIYSNHHQLVGQHRVSQIARERNQFLFYFNHGKHWFQELETYKRQHEKLQITCVTYLEEIQRLQTQLQAQQSSQFVDKLQSGVRHAVRIQEATAAVRSAMHTKYPLLRDQLYGEAYKSGRTEPHWSDEDFEPCTEEVLTLFASMPPKEAQRLLSRMMEKSAELALPQLGEAFAVAVDMLEDSERRLFFDEFFRFVTDEELQTILRDRDAANEEKRWRSLLEDLQQQLRLGIMEQGSSPVGDEIACLATFQSQEARVGAKIHEMVELIEELAAEVSFLDEAQQFLPPELKKKLCKYENPSKRMAKAKELMMRVSYRHNSQSIISQEAPTSSTCGCNCGKHRLIHEDDEIASIKLEPISDEDERKPPKHDQRIASRKSSTKRLLGSTNGVRRKNAISFGNRLSNSRRSTTQLRLFPLSEVCHLLTAILHLQFARDAVEDTTSPGGGNVMSGGTAASLIMDDRWQFLRQPSKSVTFKTLAKDYLVRKYGIKSIAIMHTLQLERSLVHYSAMEKHIRSDLFAWFFGADKLRLQSKDYAFQFFQRLIKKVMILFMKKPPTNSTLPFAQLLSIWTEYIGDGESSAGSLIRYLSPSHALEACNLSFPLKMKETSDYTLFQERMYRLGLEKDQIELETFFRQVMQLWHHIFECMVMPIQDTLANEDMLDFDAFNRCLIKNDMELTTGERLEIFDLLTQDNDESVLTKKKMINFVLEAKYLLPTQ